MKSYISELVSRNVGLASADQMNTIHGGDDIDYQSPGVHRHLGRQGTVWATLEEFSRAFGDPHEQESGDEKAIGLYYFVTPRGSISVYKYWWNREGELSIGGRGHKGARRWLKRYLRDRGFNVDRTPPAHEPRTGRFARL